MFLVTERVFALHEKNVSVGDVLHLSDAREPKCWAILAVKTTGWWSWNNSIETLWGKGRISPPFSRQVGFLDKAGLFWGGKNPGQGMYVAQGLRACPGALVPWCHRHLHHPGWEHIWTAHLAPCTPADTVLFLPLCTRWHCQLSYGEWTSAGLWARGCSPRCSLVPWHRILLGSAWWASRKRHNLQGSKLLCTLRISSAVDDKLWFFIYFFFTFYF